MRTRSHPARLLTALAALLLSVIAVPSAVSAQSNPYERGPDPTQRSIEATRGSFNVATENVSGFFLGFGGGTIYYPTDDSQGDFGVIAISPGFTGTESTISWLGPRIASQGFVVITIATNSLFDFPASRGDQLLAALDYVIEDSSSTVRSRVDSSRQAAMGHSMGGGGSLEAASDRDLDAIVPLTAWNTDKTWYEVDTPALVIGAENDSVAPVGSHSIPFYDTLGGEKAYLELNNASHFAPISSNTTIAAYSISWLKRFVDNDTRYTQFLCGPNHEASFAISDYRDTCPY